MHTNEIVHDTFLPRWYGRLGNNIQQISNGIYFCRQNNIHFTSPDQPMIEAIDLNFGDTPYKIREDSDNWFYHFDKPWTDFDVDIADLNLQRKNICEEYILPKLKVNHTPNTLDNITDPLPDDVLVIHIRSGDLYTNWPGSHTQNPLKYYIELYNMYQGKVIIVAEDDNNPIVKEFQKLNATIYIWMIRDAYEMLLRARNLASSGSGSFVMGAALCSKNLKKFYCTNLWLPNSINPTMLKDHLEVNCADIDLNKYIKVGEWNLSRDTIDKLINYNETISFRRL